MEEESTLLNSHFKEQRIPLAKNHSFNLKNEPNGIKDKFEKLVQFVQTGNCVGLEVKLRWWKAKDLVEFEDERGRILLHIAAEYLDQDCIRILLESGSNPNKVDEIGRSPLHWAVDAGCHCEHCSNKIIKCIEKLIEFGVLVNAEDLNGYTALELAGKNFLPKCALVLIDHGAHLTSGDEETGELMVERMPEVFLRILDRCIRYDEEDKSKLRLDFGWLYKTHREEVHNCHSPRIHLRRRRRKNVSPEFNEMFILMKLTKVNTADRRIILTHPWLEAFLHLKWLAVRKWFWLLRGIYLCFVLFYTYIIFEIYVWRCPYNTYYSNNASELKPPAGNYSEAGNATNLCQTNLPDIPVYVCATIAVTCMFCMVLNEIFEFKLDRKAYMTNYLNILWWNLIISLGLTMPPLFGMVPRPWQYPVAAFGLFHAWGMNFTQISRLPFFGDYIEMLGKVLTDFLFFVTTFVSLIIAFTLSMCVMFPDNDFFSNVPIAFVKVLIIMIGEPDYEGLFTENERNQDLGYSIPAHVLYVGFIFVLTIVLMNLLLALAVSDIQELRKQSAIKRAIRQITQISILETFISNVGVGTWLASHVLRRSSVQATIGRHFTFSPINALDNKLPDELKRKFIPYLTSSPCLRKQHNKFSKIRTILAPIRWKNYRHALANNEGGEEMVNPALTSPTKQYGVEDCEKEQLKLILKALDDNMMDVKSQLEKLSIKIDRKL